MSLDLILPEPLAPSSGLVEMPADVYHADPCDTPSLSSSLARVLLTSSPAHARIAHPKLNPDFEKTHEEKKFDLGTVAHELLLEGDSAVCVIDAADWRTKAAQEQRDLAWQNGQTPLLAKDWVRVEQMANAARRQLEMYDLDPAPLTDGKPERVLTWDDDGVMCRIRLDWIRDDLRAVDDLKTTAASADPARWAKTMFGMGADVQAAFYLRGIKKALGADPVWRFVVQENYRPYALSVVTLTDELLAHAGRRVARAIDLWRRCLQDNHWPSYSRDPGLVGLPAWMADGAPPAVHDFGNNPPF